ncbi:MAG: DEAD/DEAH box helicase family protein [Peptococcaceae bacterium]|jgi:ATP-dependent DNA helicase DinG|nr:DEAD/DEAH box helicase family protein [Peptococcaceae bacterium]
MDKRIIVCDLETTGLDPKFDKIIEVGLVSLEKGVVTGKYHSLVNPGINLRLNIKRLTGLDDADLVDAPSIEDIMPQILDFIAEDPIAGHNVQFDISFLAFARGLPLKNHSYDTLELARLLVPFANSYRLESLCQEFGIDLVTSHRALDDALATAHLLEQLFSMIRYMEMDVLMQVTKLLLEAGSNWYGVFNDVVKSRLKSIPEQKISTRAYWLRGESKNSPSLKEFNASSDKKSLEFGEIRAVFAPEGALADVLPNYEYRSQQEMMACTVAETLNDKKYLLMEAGTGVGKSMAYLVPAVLWSIKNHERVLIATNTINLQEQLWYKDIPVLGRIISEPFRAALAKGRQNYICLRRWFIVLENRHQPNEAAFYARVLVWLTKTDSGDRSELNLVGFEEDLWIGICGDAEGCTWSRCPYLKDCWVQKARKRAEEANLIITNHSLLFTDVKSDNRVLPAYGPLIIDEAHHLEESATLQLGRHFSQSMFNHWLNVVGKALARLIDRIPPEDWIAWSASIKKAQGTRLEAVESMRAFYKLLGDAMEVGLSGDDGEQGRATVRLPGSSPKYGEVLVAGGECIKILQHLAEDLIVCAGFMEAWSIIEEAWAGYHRDLVQVINSGKSMVEDFEFILSAREEGFVYWVDIEFSPRWGARYYNLMAAPIDIGSMLYERLFSNKSTVIMTSATITVNGSYDYFIERNGLSYIPKEELITADFDSPFLYDQQALLCINRDLPVQGQVQENVYLDSLANTIYKLVEITGGKTLVLFTSHKTLRYVYRSLKTKLESRDIYLLGHGLDGSRSRLLEEFRKDSRTVLFGAFSFWEGIDIPGEALSCVIIVKLPFMSPAVPVIAARLEDLANREKDGFRLLSLPQAVIRFKQGFGRLIRSRSDKGIVVILDGRILNKSYGRQFLNSLPVKKHIRGSLDVIIKKILEWSGTEYTGNDI